MCYAMKEKGKTSIANNTYGEIELHGRSPILTVKHKIANAKPDDFTSIKRKREK